MRHELLDTYYRLATLAEEYFDMDTSRDDISVNVKGINYFTWIGEVRCKNVVL